MGWVDFLRRRIGVGVKGVAGSDTIVAQGLHNSSIMFNYCALVEPRNPEKRGKGAWQPDLLGTIAAALPFVNYHASPFVCDPFTLTL